MREDGRLVEPVGLAEGADLDRRANDRRGANGRKRRILLKKSMPRPVLRGETAAPLAGG